MKPKKCTLSYASLRNRVADRIVVFVRWARGTNRTARDARKEGAKGEYHDAIARRDAYMLCAKTLKRGIF